MNICSIEEILEDVRIGKPIVLVDDSTRENEGDIYVAAEKVTPEVINFMITEGRGLICISLTRGRLRELGVPMQVTQSNAGFGTNFAVSFDHASVSDRAVSASARATTILKAVDPESSPEDFIQPGMVFPVAAVPGGVLKRRGQTEGSVDLSRLAGLDPSGVICEVMGSHGLMLRGEELATFCKKFELKVTSVEEIVQYRLRKEPSIRRVSEAEVVLGDSSGRSKGQKVRVIVYVDDVDGKEHMAFVKDSPKNGSLIRIHSECLTGDIFGSRRCDCGFQFQEALDLICESGSGVLVYLHQEGRGIGLGNKLKAYELQDQAGLDTVDANEKLGFAADARDYRAGAKILLDLGLEEVRVLTNNPAKVQSLQAFGIEVLERVPLTVAMDEHNMHYLETKRDRMGHIIE